MNPSDKLKIIFMGTPDFAARALAALHESDHDVMCVYTQPPRPKGRGHHVQNSPVHDYALSRNIPVFHPASLKDVEEHKKFASLNADVAVVAAYGLILPKAILAAPKFGCINIHASLLPRWRGASPIQHAVWAGDAETGVTLMQMDEGLDTGPMIAKRAVAIAPETTSSSLHDELAALGGAMIVEAVNKLAREGKLDSEMQKEPESTYAPLLTKEDGRVNWNQSAVEIGRQVRALNPWPGVWSVFNGRRIKILETALTTKKDAKPAGEILDKDGHVACGGGTAIKLLKIQPENAKAMDFAAAVNGGILGPGEKFSTANNQ